VPSRFLQLASETPEVEEDFAASYEACGGTKFYQDTPYLFQRPRGIQALLLVTSSIQLDTSKYKNILVIMLTRYVYMVLGESLSRKTLLHLMRCQKTWFGNHYPMRRKTSSKRGRKSVQ
jgi:hypothetical protein